MIIGYILIDYIKLLTFSLKLIVHDNFGQKLYQLTSTYFCYKEENYEP